MKRNDIIEICVKDEKNVVVRLHKLGTNIFSEVKRDASGKYVSRLYKVLLDKNDINHSNEKELDDFVSFENLAEARAYNCSRLFIYGAK